MRILLDTHAWLWLQSAPERFSHARLSELASPRTHLILSAASSWEIAFKYALGKLSLPIPPARYVPDRMRRSGTKALPISHAHALCVAELPEHHRDPFDRLLIAQAMVEDLPILTADPVFQAYAITTLAPA